MNDVRYDLRAYGFCTKVPLVTKDTQWKHYFDEKFANINIDIDPQEIKETIETTIETTLDTTLDEKLTGVHEHIESAKNHLCCDICCAKNDIKKHIDDKIDPIQFEEQFSNLNEQVNEILEKLNNNNN